MSLSLSCKKEVSGCALTTVMYYFSHRVPGSLSRNAQFQLIISTEVFKRLSSWRIPGGQTVSSCRLTGLYWLNHVVRFVASSIVIPHLKIKLLQVHCVLFRVKQRTRYSLLPDFATNFFQATKKKQQQNNNKKPKPQVKEVTRFQALFS